MMGLEHVVRIGIVSSIENEAQRLVRVAFPGYNDKVTNSLKVVSNTHSELKQWIPIVGQLVLCLFLPNGNGDGFVLGGL